MRTTIVGATLLLFGAGAASVGALDNVNMQGSDTLEDITKDVLAQCPLATAAGIAYRGGGSTTGENAMIAGTQTVSPMSRFINAKTGTCAAGSTAEGLAIALDGLAIVAGATNANACGGGLAYSNTKSFAVVDGSGNPVVNCPGCDAGTNTYKLANWRDVIALVYGGKTHAAAGTPGAIDCDGAVRRSLVDTWGNLFEAACSGASCTQLRRAFRRADLSGTTDTFLTLVGLSSMPQARSVPGAVAGTNAFCNAHGAGAIFGGDSDYMDRDPIRRPCETNEQVCSRTGTLGLVTVVEVPANLTQAQNYPTQLCQVGKFRLLRPATTSGITSCPNGLGLLFGKCFQPIIELPTPGEFTAECIARRTPVQGFAANGMDGRAYNQFLKDPTGLYRRDNLNRFITGAFYRIHATATIAAGAATCQTGSATTQIGCLVQANPCSIGFAGREATQQANVVGLQVNGLSPTQGNIENLVTTPSATDDYVLARKLFFNTLAGFESVTGGELELSKCMANNSIVGPIAVNRGFIAMPTGVQCDDFNEQTLCGAGSNANACGNNPAWAP